MIKILVVYNTSETNKVYLTKLGEKYNHLFAKEPDSILYKVTPLKLSKSMACSKRMLNSIEKLYVDSDSINSKKDMEKLFEFRKLISSSVSMFCFSLSGKKTRLSTSITAPIVNFKTTKSGWKQK